MSRDEDWRRDVGGLDAGWRVGEGSDEDLDEGWMSIGGGLTESWRRVGGGLGESCMRVGGLEEDWNRVGWGVDGLDEKWRVCGWLE